MIIQFDFAGNIGLPTIPHVDCGIARDGNRISLDDFHMSVGLNVICCGV